MHVRMRAWRRSRSLVASGLLGHRGCRTAVQIATQEHQLELLRKERDEALEKLNKKVPVQAPLSHLDRRQRVL